MANVEDSLYPLLGRYVAAPQWVKWLVGSTWARLPKRLKHGSGHTHWQALAAERQPAQLAALAQLNLRETLLEALQQVPAYEAYRELAHDLSDPLAVLQQLPPVGKAELKAALPRYLSRRHGPRQRLLTFTGGSTSEPLRFYLHAGVTRMKEYAFMADFHARIGQQDDDISLALRGRSVPTAAHGGRLWMYDPIKRWLVLSSDHLEPRFMPQYVQAMQRWRPTIITANPSGAYPLAKWLKAHPCPEVTERIKGVLLFGEQLHEHQMADLRAVFGCPVLNHYGHSERVLMGAAVPGDDRLHFWPQYGHLELLDDAGRPITRPGVVGEVVGTSFHNLVQPFVRYRTGDLGAWSARPPAAGLEGFPVLEHIEGRLQEFVVCSDARLVSIATLGAAHFSELAEVGAIQYEQHTPGRVVLKVETRQPLGEAARLRVEQAVWHKTQGGIRAEVREVPFIERTQRGKRSLLQQKLDLSGYLGASHRGGA